MKQCLKSLETENCLAKITSKGQSVTKAIFITVLTFCLMLGLSACGNSEMTETSKMPETTEKQTSDDNDNNTIVGNWSYIDESVDWTLGFTEDGDFYDSRGSIFLYIEDGPFHTWENYADWRIRADGKLWLEFTTSLNMRRLNCTAHYTYELDGDTLIIEKNDNKYTFKRIT